MTSPVLPTKTKKSPCLTDSHHLFDAVCKGKIHLTRFILAAANSQLQNSWDQDGRTPLIACCDIKEEGTRDQIVQILLEGGADVNMTDREGRSPLIHACMKRCNDIVRILIHHHNIKPDIEDDYGNTALIYSAAVGNDVATELLTRNFRRLGLHVDHYNKQGDTAILVATKNGNMNCAKILAQKGRASVQLKDKEQGLTPMEWCLKEGYDKDELEFLKPMTRFYRVAKLATSLSRSRSTISSLSHEILAVVSPSKSVDSCIGDGAAKGRSKMILSRSKSQTVESSAPDIGGGNGSSFFRQSTVDLPTDNHRSLASGENRSKVADIKSSLVSGIKLKDWKIRKEDKKSTTKASKNTSSVKDTSEANTPEDDPEGVSSAKESLVENVHVIKLSEKSFSVDASSFIQSPDDNGSGQRVTNKFGRLRGLGCSLDVSNMVSPAESLGSSDFSGKSSGLRNKPHSLEIVNVSDPFYDHVSAVKPNHTIRSDAEDAGKEVLDSTVSASDSAAVESKSVAIISKSKPGLGKTQVEAAEGRTPDKTVSRHFADKSYCGTENARHLITTCKNTPRNVSDKNITGVSPWRLNDSHPPPWEGNALDDSSASQTEMSQTDPSDRNVSCPQRATRLRADDNTTLDAEDEYSDSGHNVLSLVNTSTTSITEYTLPSSSSGQETRNISRACGSQEISQDA